MSANINFYNLEDNDTNDFLYIFLSKVYNEQKKALVYFPEKAKRESLDTSLWTKKKLDFLPHSLNTDNGADITPIVITSQLQNINNANFLITDSYIDDADFLSKFENIYYIISYLQIEKSRSDYKKYEAKNYTMNSIKKDEKGNWVKQAIKK
jgi:DNA polymerase IIIc chi subunit